MSDENPFDDYDIDPLAGPEAITERFRELSEDADEIQREALRAVWERLVTHPRDRLQAAFEAFPETRSPWGHAPPPDHAPATALVDPPLGASDFSFVPSIAAALAPMPERPHALPHPSDDPLLREHS
jgi:hypothetical protein